MLNFLQNLFFIALMFFGFMLLIFIAIAIQSVVEERTEEKERTERNIKNIIHACGDLDVTFEQFMAMYNIRPELFIIHDFSVERMGEKPLKLNFRTERDAKKFLIWKERKEEYEAMRREQEARYRNSVLVKNLLEADIEYAKNQASSCNYRANEIIKQIKENVKEEERRQND